MILDSLALFCDQQAVTATAVSTDKMDLSSIRHIGDGEQMVVYILVEETVTAAGAATVDFQFVVDDNAALSSPAIAISSGAIAKAILVAGFEIRMRIPVVDFERFIGMNFVVATGPLTTGKFTAGIVLTADKQRNYPSGFSVS